MSKAPFSPKQVEFILKSNARINIAHGSVSAGKTVAAIYKFLQCVMTCPGESIYMTGFSLDSIFGNIVNLIMNSEELNMFAPFCSWSRGSKELTIGPKTIKCIGAGDEGALGKIQGLTIDLILCDEMTLYPDNVIDMLDTRLRRDHSQMFATMNPKQPTHRLKKWIDFAEAGDPRYYSLHFTVKDNPFLPASYAEGLEKSLSGLFYKRNYLGIWCQAEGAIFDFFERELHVVSRPPRAAEYWIAGLDYGAVNPTACVLIGVNTGRSTQSGPQMWVEKEYYWDPHKTNRQKTNFEFANDLELFLAPYGIKGLYVDPSAAAFKLELRRKGIPCIDADNDVLQGILKMTSLMQKGVLTVCSACSNTIREIEGYVWDAKKAKIGEDAPLKQGDHAMDALRYAVYTHKVSTYQPPTTPQNNYVNYGQYRMG